MASKEKSEVSIQQLPSGPPSLCFDKEVFMKKEFNVEQFIVDSRRRVPMETLRDDLSVYLKILQSAMIELINKDYADFVNLSTNLVGVDKALSSLMSPLEQLREEVINASSTMEDTIAEVEEQMRKQRAVRARKNLLEQLMNMVKSVEKIEKLLGLQSSDDSGPRELTGHLLERVGTEFNKLQFFVNKCRGMPLVEQIRPRMASITSCLQQSLEGWLRGGLERSDTAMLTQCLRTYATIDRVAEAHMLFRQLVVRPYMEQVISEESVRSESGLSGMYDAILQFIPDHCKPVLDVTTKSKGGESVQGFDFLVHAVWPEIVSNIEARTPSIFAPGNPQTFHQKYTLSMGFVDQFERKCSSQASVKRLRAHPSYNTFMSKWSLPVYFQIRFQEIAGAFETALNQPFDKTKGSPFLVAATECLWQSISQCWSPDIYLSPLAHRFWKLTLQLIARYTTWMKHVATVQITEALESSKSTADSNSNSNSSGVSKPVGGNGEPGAPAMTPAVAPVPVITMHDVVNLLTDVHTLTATKSMEDCCSGLQLHVPALTSYIVSELTSLCAQPLRMVTDIPRLYRRTNREVPSKPSSYVGQIVRPLEQFVESHGGEVEQDQQIQWLTTVTDNTLQSFLSTTSDVLTSVKKMEESLKRLKKGKNAAANADGMTDDDKIRLQLYLDVKYFGEQMSGIGVNCNSIEAFSKLYSTVEEAAKKGPTDSS